MKKIFGFTLILTLAMALIGCQKQGIAESETLEESKLLQVTNPIQSNVDEADFLLVEIPVEAPDGAEDVIYNIVGEEVAEMTFILDQCSYTLRASKTIEGQELHGVYETLGDTATGISRDGVNFGWSMRIFTIEQGGQIATNTIHILDNDAIYLTLVTKNDNTEIETLMTNISNQIIDTITSEEITDIGNKDWGIKFTASDVTPTGLTIICEQADGLQQGELSADSTYWIEIFEEGTWQAVSYLPLEHEIAWTSEGWTIFLNDTTKWSVDWQWLYGELPNGEYRIGKSVMDFIEAGNYENQTYYATFTIK